MFALTCTSVRMENTLHIQYINSAQTSIWSFPVFIHYQCALLREHHFPSRRRCTHQNTCMKVESHARVTGPILESTSQNPRHHIITLQRPRALPSLLLVISSIWPAVIVTSQRCFPIIIGVPLLFLVRHVNPVISATQTNCVL